MLVPRVTHPWPFLGLLLLVLGGIGDRLRPETWTVIALYLIYLTPYICTSFYGRYAFPLLAAAENWPATPWLQPWQPPEA